MFNIELLIRVQSKLIVNTCHEVDNRDLCISRRNCMVDTHMIQHYFYIFQYVSSNKKCCN